MLTGPDYSLKALASKLEELMGPEALTPRTAAFVLHAARMLAEGKPVSVERVSDALALDHRSTQAAIDLLNASHQLNYTSGGLINAVAGLSLVPTNHRFIVDGKMLYTWCAVDALFLPELLGKTAKVESRCPVSDQAILLTVAPGQGIVSATPDSAAVSIMVPSTDNASEQDDYGAPGWPSGSFTPEEITDSEAVSDAELFGATGAFCSRAFFFRSLQEAESWIDHNEELIALTVRDAYEVAMEAWVKPILSQADRN